MSDNEPQTAPVPNVRQGAVSGIDHEPLQPRERSTLAGHPDYRAGSGAGDDSHDGDNADELRGEALDAALEERGLSKSGTADEKRARVAEHDADQNKS